MMVGDRTGVAGHVDKVYVSCPLCGRDEARVLYEPWNSSVDTRDVLSASGGVRGTQRIVRCLHCGLVYVNPRLESKVVVESYASAVDDLYVGAAAGRMATFRRCVRTVERYAARGKLLDVGCAAGFFVKAARDAGWDAVGVEPCRWLSEYGSTHLGVEVIPSTLREAGLPSASFDVVTMWDVLEHVPEPVAELVEVRRILKPGGLLLVNFPDMGTWFARLAGKRWWFLLSVHLTYPTRQTLGKMLEAAGFTDLQAWPHLQVLELGHLIKMGALYAPGLSRSLSRAVERLHIDGLPIPYYASQTTEIARKPTEALQSPPGAS